jgi:hypothetical protein
MAAAAHRDLLVDQPIGRIQDPCPLHDPERQRQRRGTTLQLQPILPTKLDLVAARPRLTIKFATRPPAPLHNSTNFRTPTLVDGNGAVAEHVALEVIPGMQSDVRLMDGRACGRLRRDVASA